MKLKTTVALVGVLVFSGCGSKLRVASSTAVGNVVSADCVNGGWGSVDKTIIKTKSAVVPVRWCQPISLGAEAWLTTYHETNWLFDDQCWLYVSGRSYNCKM